ncbi:LolA family protein [Halobiforma nitratireducens]|nr:hypothetical protein [Halobiforma nitratireducens]
MNVRRAVIVLAVVAILLLVGGYLALELGALETGGEPVDGGPDSDADPDPTALFASAFVHAEDLENVHGERTTELDIEDGPDRETTRTQRVEIVERPYVEYRSEVLDSDESDRIGDIYVSNASVSWWYDPDANTASYYPVDDPFDDEAVRTDRAEHAEHKQDLYDLEYLRTETVADRDAHVLSVEAKNETVAEGLSVLVGDTEFVYALETVDPDDKLVVDEQRLWIDAEYEYPLKEQVVVRDENEADDDDRYLYVMSEQFETVTFNDPSIDGETFAFDPPENTTVTDLSE